MVGTQILIIERDPVARMLMTEFLTSQGYVVHSARSGEDGLARCSADLPDLVVVAMQLPGMDGAATCRAVHALPGGADVPVLVVTASSDAPAIQRAFEAGATDFTTKPVTWPVFAKRVAHTLQASRSRQSLEQEQQHNRSLLDALPDLMLCIDASGTVCRARSAPGFPLRAPPPLTAASRRLTSWLPDAAVRPFLLAARRVLTTGFGETLDFPAASLDGDPLHLEARLVPGAPSEVLAIVRDITERTRAVAAARESDRRLNQAAKMEAVGRLAGGIAHDFNNLLMAILGYSELAQLELEDLGLPTDTVGEVIDAAQHAAGLTRQLLAISRQQVFDPTAIDINTAVRGIERMLCRLLGEDIAIELALTDQSTAVLIDRSQLTQVLLNLAVNARDAMPEGGTLRLSTALDESGVVLTVSDTGVGMDEDTRQRAFDPFFTTKAVGEGTGLGLATIYGVIQRAGGHIDLDSAQGQGTRFTLWFPLLPTETSAPDTSAAPGLRLVKPSNTGTVLIVEDEPRVRRVVTERLTRQGYTVLSGASGEEALSLADRHDGRIDLLLTDIVMPGMNGMELADRLSQKRPTLGILLMSGYSDHPTLRRSDFDRDAFIQKPFSEAHLADRVESALRRARGRG